MTYAVLADVQSRLPWFTFSATTAPSDDDVELWIDEASAILRATLQANEIDPDPAPGSQGYKVLTHYVVSYVAGRVRQVISSTTLEDATDGTDEIDKFTSFLEQIKRDPSYASAMISGGSPTANSRRARALITDDPDAFGDEEPLFSRDMDF